MQVHTLCNHIHIPKIHWKFRFPVICTENQKLASVFLLQLILLAISQRNMMSLPPFTVANYHNTCIDLSRVGIEDEWKSLNQLDQLNKVI